MIPRGKATYLNVTLGRCAKTSGSGVARAEGLPIAVLPLAKRQDLCSEPTTFEATSRCDRGAPTAGNNNLAPTRSRRAPAPMWEICSRPISHSRGRQKPTSMCREGNCPAAFDMLRIDAITALARCPRTTAHRSCRGMGRGARIRRSRAVVLVHHRKRSRRTHMKNYRARPCRQQGVVEAM